MAGASLLALLDDIATVLDDVAILSKVAARKTAAVLGDDLALNAEQVSGVRAERELPVVWAVAKGSARNKLILVPSALAISAIIPWLITPLLMLGGLYLCFEGFEKIAHRFLHSKAEDQSAHIELVHAVADKTVDMVEFEKQKIRGAIRTDFILSAEIIVISLGVVADAAFSTQVVVVSLIAAAITVGVYGLVAGIVKLDDAGLALVKNAERNGNRPFQKKIGYALVQMSPKLMKLLTIVGTAAMFLVGGGIIVHGIPQLGAWLHAVEQFSGNIQGIGSILTSLAPALFNGIAGLVIGGIAVAVSIPIQKLRSDR
jgi:hypothetical protein